MGRGPAYGLNAPVPAPFDPSELPPPMSRRPPSHAIHSALGPLDQPWRASAACRTQAPDTFFPTGDTAAVAQLTEAALRICATCPVQAPCLDAALRLRIEHGVWGGTTPAMRRRLAARSRLRAIPSPSGPPDRSAAAL